jgi:hypothetical protein
VLDVDGEEGSRSLKDLIAYFNIGYLAALTPCVSRTPSGGLHLIFRMRPGERPRNRARDIGPGLDTRGVKANGTSAGYFIGPGSVLPDGRRYQLVDASTLELIDDGEYSFKSAFPAPLALLGLASFSAAESGMIAASRQLQVAILGSDPCEWPTILERHRIDQRTAAMAYPMVAYCHSSEAERQQQYR